MEYVNLGNSGLKVSAYALGTWLTVADMDPRQVDALLGASLDAGVNLFDTADVYDHGAAESVLGQQLLAGRRRDHLVIATKAYFPMSDSPNDRGLSRKHLFESIHASLRRLGSDYVDLYQCHRYDDAAPLAETVRAMGDLIRQGKILYWGTSMWNREQLVQACQIADTLGVPRPISEQPRYNLLCREVEDKVIPAGEKLGIGFLFWSPLAQGYLTGKYRGQRTPPGGSRAASPRRFGSFLDDVLKNREAAERLERIAAVAERFQVPLPVLALAWCRRRTPSCSVLIGATSAAQMRDNLRAATYSWPAGLDEELAGALRGAPLAL